MWVLTRDGCPPASEGLFLLPNVEYVVGRKDCAILIKNDPSISRKHAVITVSHTEDNLKDVNKLPKVSVQDTSKYGVSVNGSKIIGTGQLKDGDQILFGTRDSQYRITYTPLVTVTSCLSTEKKNALRSILLKLGGHVLDEWKADCVTHLVMDGLTFTIKVVHALAQCCHVVTPAFFQQLAKAIDSKVELPSAQRFLPATKEDALKGEDVLFEPVQARRSLLRNKTLLFLSKKQFRRVHVAVELSGGQPALKLPLDKLDEEELLSDGTLVVMVDSKELSSQPVQVQHWVAQVVDTLRIHNRRTIPESELGLALLHLSMEKYCNPSIDAAPALTQSLVDQSLHAADLFSQQIQLQAPGTLSQSFKKPVTPAAKTEKPNRSARSAVAQQSVPIVVPETQSQGSREKPPSGPRKPAGDEVVHVADTPERAKSGNYKRAFECVIEDSHEVLHATRTFAPDTPQNGTSPVGKLHSSGSSLPWRHEAEPIPDSEESDAAARVSPPPPKRPKTLGEYFKRETSPGDTSKRGTTQRKEADNSSWLNASSVPKADTRLPTSDCGQESSNCSRSASVTSCGLRDNSVTTETEVRVAQKDVEDPTHRGEDSALGDGDPQVRGTRRGKLGVDTAMPEGFLCASIPRDPTDTEALLGDQDEDDLPRNVIVVEHVALVVRRDLAKAATTNIPSTVKNFKKFRKQWYPGSGVALPRIIGGSDLAVHQSTKAPDREEWFLEAQQVEAQQTKQDRIAEDLFRWDGSQPLRGRRARR